MFISKCLPAVSFRAYVIPLAEMLHIGMGDQSFFLHCALARADVEGGEPTDLKSFSQPSTSHFQSLPNSPPLLFFFAGNSISSVSCSESAATLSSSASRSRCSCSFWWARRPFCVENTRPLHEGWVQLGGWEDRMWCWSAVQV